MIDFTQALHNLDGSTAQAADRSTITLGLVTIEALLAGDPRAQSAAEKVMRYDLALRIHREGKANLSIDEAKLVKDAIGATQSALVVGQAFPMLETTSEQLQ